MKLIQSKTASLNYLAKVVEVKEFYPHPNADKLKIAKVGGYNVVVGLDEDPGLYIYFPTLSQINPELLSYANLYRHTEKNANPEAKPGFFEDNGKVTAIKLRQVVSEGFLLPAVVFGNFIVSNVNVPIQVADFLGTEFDSVEHNGKEFWINKKYIVVKTLSPNGTRNERRRQGKLKRFDRIIEEQFRFHYDTAMVKKNPFCVNPDDLIHISTKIHGTSAIFANVLTKKPISKWKSILKWLSGEGWKNYEEVYDIIYASRSVIKNQYYNKEVNVGYYGCDVWGEANKIISPKLEKGMTIYAEIVGFLPNGGYIQKNYDYGCVPPEEGEEYTAEKHFKVRPYRITLTNVDGQVHEFSAREVQQWCFAHDLIPVKELYYGKADSLYREDKNKEWHEAFWEKMANDKKFYMEQLSPDCANKVPNEGVVIRIEDMKSHAFKLKCFAFISGELANNESNIEDES